MFHYMNFRHLSLFLVVTFLLSACSRPEEEPANQAYISGTIVVDDMIDPSGDNSGITLMTTMQNEAGQTDTLFFAQTDSLGNFSSTARFDQKDIYPVFVSRNRNTFGYLNIIFADGDSVTVEGRLPNLNENVEISSEENDVYKIFDRVDRSFSRVASFINAGGLSADSVQAEIEKWSDIYWEIFEDYPDTYAAKISGESAVAILRGLNDSLMVERAEILMQKYDNLMQGTRSTLLEYYAETEGLDRALQFLDQLKSKTTSKSEQMDMEMHTIEILFDSSRTNQANVLLQEFQNNYADNEHAMDWATSISYDLEFLAPGSPFPPIQFITVDGDSLNTEELTGRPFLIEITRLDNRLYQQQFDRTVAIYQIYRNFDLEIITIPIATTMITLEAFFDERSMLWNVAVPDTFDADELIDILNINRVPTRFLVNGDGKIIRRYIGNEYDDVVRGLQQITTINE